MTDRLFKGDCLQFLRTLDPNSLDSLVTDPPAGISFMGKAWDDDKGGRDAWVAWLTEVMRECMRVLKPGAHGFVWALPRTSHWTATALENAGFEIRDVVTHLFGTGFPKSMDISKAIDKAAGAARAEGKTGGEGPFGDTGRCGKCGKPYFSASACQCPRLDKIAITEAAKQWSGWGTALKPASEHWILVRKPLAERTVAANVLKHGTGGINVDGCRIGTSGGGGNGLGSYLHGASNGKGGQVAGLKHCEASAPTGRFPANLVLSHNDDCEQVGTKKVKAIAPPGKPSRGQPEAEGAAWSKGHTTPNLIAHNDGDGTETVAAWVCSEGCAVAMLDEQSGTLGNAHRPNRDLETPVRAGNITRQGTKKLAPTYEGTGGASRFFYCAKASKTDRNRKAKDGK